MMLGREATQSQRNAYLSPAKREVFDMDSGNNDIGDYHEGRVKRKARFRMDKYGGVCSHCGKRSRVFSPIANAGLVMRYPMKERALLREKLRLCGRCWAGLNNRKGGKAMIEAVLKLQT